MTTFNIILLAVLGTSLLLNIVQLRTNATLKEGKRKLEKENADFQNKHSDVTTIEK